MVSPTVLPGRGFQQTTPNSNLLFHWRSQSRDLVTVDRSSTGTLTRASAGGLTDGRGQRTANALTDVRLVGPAADNQPRWGVSTAGVPHLLLEDTRTNLLPISKPTTGWQTVAAISTGGETTVAPDGTLVTLLTDNSTTARQEMIQDAEVASTVAVVTWHTKWNGSTFGAIHRMSFDAAGVAARAQVTWEFGSTGAMAITSTGAGNVISAPAHIGNNWWKTSIEATGILSTQDNQLVVSPAVTAVGTTGGDMFISEIQVEDVASTGLFASSHIPTVSAAVTRALETLSFPFLPVPQAMTVYCKFVEAGSAVTADTPRLWQIGDNTGAGSPRWLVFGSGGKYLAQHDPGSGAQNTAATLTAPSIGNVVEIRVVLNVDGSQIIGQTINGGAEVTAASSANGLAAAWASTTVINIGASGDGERGFNKFREIKIAAGVQTMTQMREGF